MQHLACATEVPNVGCWELRLPILLAVVLGIQRVTCYSVEIFRPDSRLRQRSPSLFSMCLTDQFWKVPVGSGTPETLGWGADAEENSVPGRGTVTTHTGLKGVFKSF